MLHIGDWGRRLRARLAHIRRPNHALRPCLPRSSGISSLDAALGGGLYPGRIALLQGAPGAGKTALGLLLAAAAQRLGDTVAWLDIDHTLLAARAQAVGLDPATPVARCRGPAQAVAMAQALLATGRINFLVLDPWPPEDPPAAMWRPLKALGRTVAESGATLLVTQPRGREAPGCHNALRYVCATVLFLQPAASGTIRATVRKHPRRLPAAHAPETGCLIPDVSHWGDTGKYLASTLTAAR